MSVDIYDLNCPFCEKVYKLPREKVVKHVGKTIYCRGCGNPFSVPPLPVFESNAGVVVESPKLAEVAVEQAVDTRAAERLAEEDRAIEDRNEVELAQNNGHSANGSASAIDLPPPFSAEILPAIEEVLPAVEEPPKIDLATEAESHRLSDVELPPYRLSTEHGAVTVEEETSYFHDGASAEGASAGESLGVEPIADFSNSVDPSAADFDAFAPSVQPQFVPNEPEPELKRSRPKRFVASSVQPTVEAPPSIPPSIPPGLNLDDVPIARAVSTSPPPAFSPTTPLNFRSLRSRLTFLAVMSVIIALLLAAILLALLGYIPHRPL